MWWHLAADEEHDPELIDGKEQAEAAASDRGGKRGWQMTLRTIRQGFAPRRPATVRSGSGRQARKPRAAAAARTACRP